MSHKYSVRIIAIDPLVEDWIVIYVNGTTLTCFLSYSPSVIEVGKTYEANFEIVLPDELQISKIETSETRIETNTNCFPCVIYGYMEGDFIQSLVDFEDQGIHFDYPYLNGQFVKINATRIDVSLR